MHIAYGGKRDAVSKLREKLIREDADKKGFHSSSYHRYFEGYTEYQVLGANGKLTIKREYTSTRFQQELSKFKQIAVKTFYMIMLMTEIAIIWMVAGLERVSDSGVLLVLAELATIISIAALGYTIIVEYLFMSPVSTIGEYKASSKGLQIRAKWVCFLFALDAAINGVWNLFFIQKITRMDWMGVAGFIVGAIVAFSIWDIESTISYREIQGKGEDVSPDGVEIRY